MTEDELKALRCGDVIAKMGYWHEVVFARDGEVLVERIGWVAPSDFWAWEVVKKATDSEHVAAVERWMKRGGYMAKKARELYWPCPFWAAVTPIGWQRVDADGKPLETGEAALATSKDAGQNPPRAIRLRQVPLSRLIRKCPDAVIDPYLWIENLDGSVEAEDFDWYENDNLDCRALRAIVLLERESEAVVGDADYAYAAALERAERLLRRKAKRKANR